MGVLSPHSRPLIIAWAIFASSWSSEWTTGSYPDPSSLYTRGRGRPWFSSFRSSPPNHSFVLMLLYVGHGWRTSRNAYPLCSIPWRIRDTRCLMSYEYPRPTHVAPAARASHSGFTPSFTFGAGRDFVFTPSRSVGDACPFVSPYTPLSKMMYSMSTFRRPEFTKCAAPIPSPSPSPPHATTSRPGFASFTPVANGRGRPWRVWTPYVFT